MRPLNNHSSPDLTFRYHYGLSKAGSVCIICEHAKAYQLIKNYAR